MIKYSRPLQTVQLSVSTLSGYKPITNKIRLNTNSIGLSISKIATQQAQPQQQRNIGRVSKQIIKGVRGLAEFLGCGVNKAQQIMNSGVLLSEKTTYKVGNTWITNREKLTVLLEENPKIFEKLSTKI